MGGKRCFMFSHMHNTDVCVSLDTSGAVNSTHGPDTRCRVSFSKFSLPFFVFSILARIGKMKRNVSHHASDHPDGSFNYVNSLSSLFIFFQYRTCCNHYFVKKYIYIYIYCVVKNDLRKEKYFFLSRLKYRTKF